MDQFAAMTTFVRVVETGSLSGAARSSRSSLTSVSRQIAALEARFGVQLLLRTTRRLSLTDDGRLLYERAKSVLGELKEVELALSSGQRRPAGRLRVSAPTLMGRLLIAPLLAEFLRRHPLLSVDLLLVDRTVDLIEEDIHVSLRVGRLPDSQAVVRKLGDLRMIVCASQATCNAAAFRRHQAISARMTAWFSRIRRVRANGASWKAARRDAKSGYLPGSGQIASTHWCRRPRKAPALPGCHPGR